MQINLSKELIAAVGFEKLEQFGITEDGVRWSRDKDIDLSDYTHAQVKKLREVIAGAGKVRGGPIRVLDIDRWMTIIQQGVDKVRCKKIKDWAPMLKQYLKPAPKHWLYELRANSDVYQPYYVSRIKYTPPETKRDYTTPAYVTVTLNWEELGKVHEATETFYRVQVEDITVSKALAIRGYCIETPEMLATYLENRKKYVAIHDKVGKQFLVTGVVEKEDEEEDRWYRRNVEIRADRDGVPGRVVVDLLTEGDKSDREKGEHVTAEFWRREGCDYEGSDDDDDNDIKPGDEDEEDPVDHELPNIPLAPSLMCFDLKRHSRLKVYVDQMTEYKYQTDLANKLILPEEITDLVDMLIAHKGGFKDIIGNKGGGAIILCAGPPGTGKTLTSEIYSEAEKRPLYSVQCSQLGTDPDELEKELLKVFARAQRWNAILLLDEADVYVASRGRDLKQNAIVGVFLRVLEYYGGVMFMTTNRADLVDDAIASRCLARIDYKIPTVENQKRIWRTLADTAGVSVKDSEVDKIVDKFPHLSGRDVKNLLKLGSMVAAANGDEAINAKTIDFVKQFKPTGDTKEK